MAELKNGETKTIVGPDSVSVTLNRLGAVYSCSCDQWMQSQMSEELRSCHHLMQYLGQDHEQARIGKVVRESTSSSHNMERLYQMAGAQIAMLSNQGTEIPHFVKLKEKAEKSLRRNKITNKDDDYSAFKKAYNLIKESGHLHVFPDLERRCLEQALSICYSDLVSPAIECFATKANCWIKLARIYAPQSQFDAAKHCFESSVSEHRNLLDKPHAQKMHARILKTYATFLRETSPAEADSLDAQADSLDANAIPLDIWDEVT